VSTRVLFVCTGNICRSPMAERMMLARLPEDADIIVRSAGTHALVDYPMDALAAQVAREYGADPDEHAAREASAGVIARADLVLTATTAHRDEILTRVPQALRRVFTMREFVRLGRALPVAAPPVVSPVVSDEYLGSRIAEVAAQRGQVPAPEPGADDIGDPFGGPLAGMQACGSLISSTVDSTLHILGVTPQT
jgi:protein-tyrosine phosphatase